MDSSGSVGQRTWVKMKQFLKDMVKAFNVGPDKTHIAIVAYSTRAVVEFNFDQLKGSQITTALSIESDFREASPLLTKL